LRNPAPSVSRGTSWPHHCGFTGPTVRCPASSPPKLAARLPCCVRCDQRWGRSGPQGQNRVHQLPGIPVQASGELCSAVIGCLAEELLPAAAAGLRRRPPPPGTALAPCGRFAQTNDGAISGWLLAVSLGSFTGSVVRRSERYTAKTPTRPRSGTPSSRPLALIRASNAKNLDAIVWSTNSGAG